ncbi:TonB-linked outer membrane protein, SusC/RagA family [Tenacibaculum sp. MAR_2009_124]|uniref:SusC/RagA family TonB-linked outer membrane protein n=1 Tax=Tenacibaculum sp. MAR_2009_124 TaxID=1250059 RepID=UPI0008967E23|nr:SusC/RagA family TonB-linked outer membrane protein [Tenacibaculum sp. MAR_2009_124]SEB70844.1 TonB-linked outer membrane protein, SusC/RagA family [Tenacibaculum sp. MAR_2009_124]
MKKSKILLLLCFSFLLVQFANAQEKTLSGVVTAKSDGMPLPGVGVLIKGTLKGVETDFDGKYQIKASTGDVLVFSYVGMKSQSITVINQQTINVALEDANVLDEVVVTALGIKKEKKALGYAVSNVKAEDLQMAKDPNVVNSLQGRVAGLEINQASGGVGSANRMVIRGNNSLTGNNQALYVVDGVPINNSENEGDVDEWGNGVSIGNGIADINPDDIESVSVLKGANAAALYGARASNGVIMITTKKGKKGKMSIGFNSSVTFEEVAFLPEFQNTYGQGSLGAIPTDGSLRSFGSWGPRLDGSTQLLWTGENGRYEANPNNVKDFFSGGSTVLNSFYVEGGSEKMTSRISYTRSDIQGVVPNNELEKNAFAAYSKLDIGKLTVDLKGNYINQKVNNRPYLSVWPDNVVNALYSMPRNVNINELEANPLIVPRSGSFNNPFSSVNTVGTEDRRNRVFGYVRANYQFSDNLTAMVRAGSDYSVQSFLGWAPINHPTIAGGQVSDNTYTNQETNIDFLVTYNKELSEDLTATIVGGGNRLDYRGTVRGGVGNGLRVPGIYNILNTESYVPNLGTGVYTRRVNSLYSTLDLDFRGYLFAQITARNDWSSVLPANNNSFFYPSVSLSAIVTDMFDIGSENLNYLKLRGSWAQVGSDGEVGPYGIHSRYLTEPNYLGNGVLTTPSTKPNPNLVPQTTNSIELGLEGKFFKNRLGLDFSYYNTQTEDQIINLPAPVESGYTRFLLNEGTLINKGIEVGLNYDIIKNDDVSWNVGVNYSHNRTTVEDLSSDFIPLAAITGNTPFRILATNNGRYGDIVGFGYKRNDQGQILVGDDGRPLASDDQQTFGNFNPDWLGGFTSNFRYKDFSFRFLISSKVGGQILSRTDMILDVNGNSMRTLEGREGGVVVPNSVVESTGAINTTAVPAQEYYQTVAGERIIEDYVFDADYIKLKELAIGYNLPQSLISKLKISSASIQLIGRNLFFFHRETDSFDPEVSGFNTRNAQGVELLSLPGTRSYGLNLSVKF